MNNKIPKLIDSHCHLDFQELSSCIDDILLNAKNNNVCIMQTICTSVDNFDKIYKFAEKYNEVYASVGIHPNNVDNNDNSSNKIKLFTVEDIVEIAKKPKIIGIGETGLDYYRGYSEENAAKQKANFIIHIKAAQITGLPIIVHTRNADENTVKILQEQYAIKKFTGVIHCFTASEWLAEECLKIGFFISASGIITFKNAENILNVFKKIDINRILIETDSPYLAPVPYRGKSNQPAYIKHVAEKLAEVRNTTFENIAENTTNNFLKLFNKAEIN